MSRIEELEAAYAQALALVGRYREALEEGASWFDAYAEEHLAKGSDEKALRNKVRANILRAALSEKLDLEAPSLMGWTPELVAKVIDPQAFNLTSLLTTKVREVRQYRALEAARIILGAKPDVH